MLIFQHRLLRVIALILALRLVIFVLFCEMLAVGLSLRFKLFKFVKSRCHVGQRGTCRSKLSFEHRRVEGVCY